MAYQKQTWTNDDPETPLSGPRMSHIEDGLEDVHSAFDDHTHAFNEISGTATAGQIPSLAVSKISGLQAELDALSDRLDALEGDG